MLGRTVPCVGSASTVHTEIRITATVYPQRLFYVMMLRRRRPLAQHSQHQKNRFEFHLLLDRHGLVEITSVDGGTTVIWRRPPHQSIPNSNNCTCGLSHKNAPLYLNIAAKYTCHACLHTLLQYYTPALILHPPAPLFPSSLLSRRLCFLPGTWKMSCWA